VSLACAGVQRESAFPDQEQKLQEVHSNARGRVAGGTSGSVMESTAQEGQQKQDHTAKETQKEGASSRWGLGSIASAGASMGKRFLDALPDD